MLSFYLNFSLFAFVASITPGPTNLISLMIGTNQGAVKAIPFILGSCLCAAIILWLSGVGLASIMIEFPLLKLFMTWGGALWMSWLSWALFFSESNPLNQVNEKKMGWLQGAGLQFVNPKTWMMALSVTGIFALPDSMLFQHVSLLAIIFFIIAVPCLLCWSWLGQSARMLSNFPKWEVRINQILSVVLFTTIWSSVFII